MADYLSLSYKGIAMPMMIYSFTRYRGMAGPGYLVTGSKELFSSPEEAMIAMVQKILYEDEEWAGDYCNSFEDEDIAALTKNILIPVYALQEIREIDPDKFRKEYNILINSATRTTYFREDSTSYAGFETEGIAKNGTPITDYANFDPLRDEVIEKSFAVFDGEQDRTEYFALSAGYYIYLFWFWPHNNLMPFRV